MKRLLRLFKITREEAWASLLTMLTLVALHTLVIVRYYDRFSDPGHASLRYFVNHFTVSGYDPITYGVVSEWSQGYNIYRHPLLAWMMYPLEWLNGLIVDTWQFNPVQFVVAALLVFCAYYSFIFIYRICREVVGIGHFDAIVLSTMLFSFAYVLTAAIVPDHFCLSMFMLLMTLYVAGRKMQSGQPLKKWETVVLFTLTAGITLSNGIKTYMAALFTNRWRFFRPTYLLLAVLLPAWLLWRFSAWEYHTYQWPKDHKAALEKKAQKEREMKQYFEECRLLMPDSDSVAIQRAAERKYRQHAFEVYQQHQHEAWRLHTGKPIKKSGFMKWTDVSTSRNDALVHNVFGESLQLHEDHLLEDTLRSRPVVVKYRHAANYVAECLVLVLFFCGIWAGRRQRFLWMVLACLAFDMLLHLGLGFGINEVYIMGPHWLFAIPIAIAYAVKTATLRRRIMLRTVLCLLVVWLLVWNLRLLGAYLLN